MAVPFIILYSFFSELVFNVVDDKHTPNPEHLQWMLHFEFLKPELFSPEAKYRFNDLHMFVVGVKVTSPAV